MEVPTDGCDSVSILSIPAADAAENASSLVSSYALQLTQEEALGLLNLALLAPCELTCPQETALEKLGAFCREFVREPSRS